MAPTTSVASLVVCASVLTQLCWNWLHSPVVPVAEAEPVPGKVGFFGEVLYGLQLLGAGVTLGALVSLFLYFRYPRGGTVNVAVDSRSSVTLQTSSVNHGVAVSHSATRRSVPRRGAGRLEDGKTGTAISGLL